MNIIKLSLEILYAPWRDFGRKGNEGAIGGCSPVHIAPARCSNETAGVCRRISSFSGAFPTRAQQGRRTYFILWVSTEAQPDPFIAGFRDGMRERGYIEGQNLAFVLHYAAGDPSALRCILWDLIKVPADLIVSSGPAILAMRAAPHRSILFAISGDPVELGIAESLSRPGKNFTGSTFMALDVAQKVSSC